MEIQDVIAYLRVIAFNDDLSFKRIINTPRRQFGEATEKVPITAFLSIFSVTLFKNYRKRTLKILRSEVFQWPHIKEPTEKVPQMNKFTNTTRIIRI